MGKAVRILFNLYPGERRKASLFVIFALAWSIGSYGTLTLSEGMFLEHVGSSSLPLSYLFVAACMTLFSFCLTKLLNRYAIRHLLFYLIAFWIISNLTFFTLLIANAPLSQTYWFAYKIVGWMMPISIYIVYWAFVDQYFDLQDGKRFFSLFISVLFLGDALGAGLISFCLKWLDFSGLILLFTALMLLSLPFIPLIRKCVPPSLEEHAESVDTTSSLSFKSIFQSVLASKFTLYLLLFYFSMQLLVIATEYTYMESIERVFSTAGNQALTEFLGKCSMCISLGNLVFGTLFYSRLVKKMGINNIVLIAPAFFIALFLIWLRKDTLFVAVLAMFVRETMAYSFDDNNFNLLISGVPTKIKNQVRIFVEAFIEPMAMFSTAALLLFLKKEHYTIGLVLAASALIIGYLLRKNYARAIFCNLAASTIRFEKKVANWMAKLSKKEKKQAEFLLLSHLKKTKEAQQLAAYDCLLKIGSPHVLPNIINHIGKLTLPGKLKAIELLRESRFAKNPVVLKRLERWRRLFPHPSLKSAIYFYYARHGLLSSERALHDLESTHLGLRSAAILSLKTNEKSSQHLSLYTLASKKLELLLHSTNENEICMGLKILGCEMEPKNMEVILEFLTYPSLKVNLAAAAALANSADASQQKLAPTLLHRLVFSPHPEVRLLCLQALEKLADPTLLEPLMLASIHFRPLERKLVEQIALPMKEKAIPILLAIMKKEKCHDRCRLLAGKILGKLDLPTLQREINTIIFAEIEKAHFYFYHAQTIQQQLPEHNLSILESTLKTRFYSVIDFIIQLLGCSESIEDSEVLAHTLRSKNKKMRATALESLEKTCSSRIFSALAPLIDESSPEEKLRYYLKGGRMPLNLSQLLDTMAHSPSVADQIASIGLKARLHSSDRIEQESGRILWNHMLLGLK